MTLINAASALGEPVRDPTLLLPHCAEARLVELLQSANGFYAFEAALHVFPAGPSAKHVSLEAWNEEDLWRNSYGDMATGMTFFAEDVFGGQFVLVDGGVGTFDPETGDVEVLAKDLDGWAERILEEYDVLTGYAIAHEWQEKFGALADGNRLVPKVPFVLGGAFTIENLYSMEADKGMRLRGDLAKQIRDLPDGAKAIYRIDLL